jgi:hypothetical protein
VRGMPIPAFADAVGGVLIASEGQDNKRVDRHGGSTAPLRSSYVVCVTRCLDQRQQERDV